MYKFGIMILLISIFTFDPAYSSQPDSLEGLVHWRYFFDSNPVQKRSQPGIFSSTRSISSERTAGLNYLNTLRNGAGLISFNANTKLDTAAQNHIDYLIFHNLSGHYENQTSHPQGFSGVSPGDRISSAGYSWTAYAENITAGSDNIYESIDSLFSAIYHRFGFLGFNNNEIGIGLSYDANYAYGSAFGFDMANSGNVSATRQLNPQYVLWPHHNYANAQTSFNNEESPDPTPECPSGGITGNPISIEFNPATSSAVSLLSFKLFKDDGTEITNTKNLTTHLDALQFALFPMTSLSIDSRYRVEFSYIKDGVTNTISWYFKTRKYTDKRYEVTHLNTYNAISGQNYIIHLKPGDCSVGLNSYSWNSDAVVERLSPDTFRISITSDTTFNFNSGSFVFSLQIASSDNAIEPSTEIITLPGTPSLTPIINYLLF